jgi:hypothetical protein
MSREVVTGLNTLKKVRWCAEYCHPVMRQLVAKQLVGQGSSQFAGVWQATTVSRSQF